LKPHDLLISDLHLDPARPDIGARFEWFLRERAVHARSLYVLGDLFEAYLGDDDDAPLPHAIANALAALPMPKFFIHGNRDFLLGEAYAARAALTVLPDQTVVELGGEPTLLLHGDVLCTDDVEYQAVRRQFRDSSWQRAFLSQPLAARRAFAERARTQSAAHTAHASAQIMDVTADAVERALNDANVRRMIHGHTHRPAVHVLENGRERIVLGDWYTQGSLLEVDANGARLITFSP
jgi:UDP-2,3-diacylglucosamine hydrolase